MMIGVIGAGESGVGAAILAKKLGFDVLVSDYGIIKSNYKEELNLWEVDFEEGQHTFEKLEKATTIIKSPGIPPGIPIINALRAKGVEVISELEFGFRHTQLPIVAITGTNGKTTTTKLTTHLLNKAGLNAQECGNIGKSLCRVVSEDVGRIWVCECSSFQLEDIISFRPSVAVILNITPDHLDRYESYFDYGKAKLRISENQNEDELLIYPAQFELDKWDLESKAQIVAVSFKKNRNLLTLDAGDFIMSNTALNGPHNAQNASVAITIARKFGVSNDLIQQGLDDFVNEPHRLEWCGARGGLDFINDSKATNVDAAEQALKSFDKRIIWIVGGVDKGNDYNQIIHLVQKNVFAIIALGKENLKIKAFFGPHVDHLMETDDIVQAVRWATELEVSEGIVLLSPACASFDLFTNYKDRGNQFKDAVRKYLNE